MSNVTIILPTKNEEETIPKTLPFLRDHYNVIVVDDSDTDLTRQEVEKIGGCVFLKGLGNESPSIRHALETIVKDKTLPFQTKYCVIMDCDGSHDLNIVFSMIESLENGSDLSVGSRYVEGGSSGSSNPFSQAGNTFARLVLGAKTKDLTGRFVASTPKLLLKLCRWKGRGEDSIELLFNAKRRGYEVKEIPFIYKSRIGGKSKTNIPKYLMTYLKKVLELKWDSWMLYDMNFISRGLARDYLDTGKEFKPTLLGRLIYFFQVPFYLVMSIPCRIPVLDLMFNFIATNCPRGITGFVLRGIYWKTKMGGMGKNCFMDYGTSVMGAENVFLGDNVHIDERCSMLCVAGKISVGEFVHVAANCLLQGKGGVEIQDMATISSLCKVYSATNYYKNEKGELVSCSAMAPAQEQYVKKFKIVIGENSFIGTGTAVIPYARIGNFAVIGSNGFVSSAIADYSIAVGVPSKIIGEIKYDSQN